MGDYREETLPDMLPLYYTRLFPYSLFYKWLSYGNKYYFANRELSFTLLSDIYLRYQSFENPKEFSHELQRLKPIKIDIGAVYNFQPKHSRFNKSFLPVEKEMVFDFDMTDYDDTRNCCKGTDVCIKCWKFMAIACKILDGALREDFGFKNLLWVFSGRRGMHCWICDSSVRQFNDEIRGAIAEYFNVIRGGMQHKKVVIYQMHSLLKRALRIISPCFKEMMIIEQNMLGTEEGLSKFLMIINEEVRGEFEKVMRKLATSEERWEAFLEHFKVVSKKSTAPKNFKNLVEEIYLHYCYPRLDINVSKSINHLLKAPFCIHPKSGKVSIPFNPKLVDKFDPSTVPTITLLVDEINQYDKITMEQENEAKENETIDQDAKNVVQIKHKIRDYKKTSLLKPVTIFDEFLKEMLPSTKATALTEVEH